jgi:hypothetical protein
MDEKIIKIYYENFLDDEYNFHGIILTAYFNREENRIDWEVDNPQNLSVSKSIILDFVHDLFYDFCLYVSSGKNGQRETYGELHKKATNLFLTFSFPKGNVFLNQKDRLKLLASLEKIDQINFKIRGGNHYIFDIEIEDYEVDNTHGEDFYCGFDVIFLSGTKNGEKIKDSEMKECIGKVLREDDFIVYQNNLMLEFWDSIVYNPLLFDNKFTYYTNDFIPYDKNGKRIVIDY